MKTTGQMKALLRLAALCAVVAGCANDLPTTSGELLASNPARIEVASTETAAALAVRIGDQARACWQRQGRTVRFDFESGISSDGLPTLTFSSTTGMAHWVVLLAKFEPAETGSKMVVWFKDSQYVGARARLMAQWAETGYAQCGDAG